MEVIDIGIAPTPTLIFLIKNMGYDGGIMISASHNPPEYNGIKFLTKNAMYANRGELEEIKKCLGNIPENKDGGDILIEEKLGDKHIDHILENIDVNTIKNKKLKVVIDTINGAGYKLGPMLLEKLGCEVVVINGEPNGNFAHMPEPLPENLVSLGEKVKEVSADIGFAQDPDADRLVMCNEEGVVVFEEYMLSVCIKGVLSKTPGDIVTNLSTSNTNEDLVNAFGYKNIRSKVGEGNVSESIIANNAVIGGEGSGGVIYPKINLCRDSLTGMALILEYMASSDKKISEVVSELPKYEFVKTKMPFEGSLNEKVEDIVKLFPDGKVDRQDGIRIDFPDRSWVQIRESNTEPIIRIWSEAKTKERALELVENIKSEIN
jgi:phosphomannomutase